MSSVGLMLLYPAIVISLQTRAKPCLYSFGEKSCPHTALSNGLESVAHNFCQYFDQRIE